jgi:hypothetical protein
LPAATFRSAIALTWREGHAAFYSQLRTADFTFRACLDLGLVSKSSPLRSLDDLLNPGWTLY